MGRRVRIVVGCILGMAGTWGQSTLGTIVGTVSGPSGLRISGAMVTARGIETGITNAVKSDAEGFYQFQNLTPETYALSAEAPGLRSGSIEVTLGARQSLRAELTLSLPEVRQSVTVHDIPGKINTEDGTIAETRNFSQIAQLPLNYRAVGTNPNALMFTVPGVRGSGGNDTTLAGGFPTQVEYSIDGISTVNVRAGVRLEDIYPSPEALREFKVTSVSANAEFGQMGDVSVISRGGTNDFHGSVLWYHQNAAMDAKTYGSPAKQAKINNTFGGSLGGPLDVPGVYRGKDRSFFRVGYEGNRKLGNILRRASVPSAQMWAGDLAGVAGPGALDPLSGLPFPGNAIPGTRINSVAVKLATFYPAPNFNSGSTFNNYRALVPNRIDTGGYDARFDQVLTSRHRIFARWTWRDIELPSNLFAISPASQNKQRNRNLVLSYTSNLRPHLLNESRAGITRWSNRENFPIRGADAVATLGLRGLDLRNAGDGGGFPGFVFGDGTGFTEIYHGREAATVSRNLQFTDNVTWISGRHTWKIGADVRRLGYDDTLHTGDNDEFGFFIFRQGAFSGNAFADLLLGLPSNTQAGLVGPDLAERTTHWHVYAQDQWRVSSRFTLSAGLRWQVHPPMTERSGNITNFDRATGNVIIPDRSLPPSPVFLAGINACPGTSTEYRCTNVITASQAGVGPGLRTTPYGNWTPRFGLAFRPFRSNRTVLRGGFGIYTQTILGFASYALTGVHTSDVRTYDNFRGRGVPPLFTFPDTSAGDFVRRQPGNASFRTATDLNYRDPRSYQWNFTIEQSLSLNVSARVSYVGTQSVGLSNQQDLNQVPVSSTPYSAGRKPFPVWSDVLSVDNIGFANYQSLESVISRRYAQAAYFQVSYTLAKHLGNAGGPGGGLGNQPFFPLEYNPRIPMDRFNLRLDRGNLGPVRRHRFLLTGIFPVPVGHGRVIGGGMSRLADAIAGGWELSTVLLLQSGQFQTPTIAAAFDRSNTNATGRPFVTSRPDRVGDGNLENPTTDQFYDISAFTAAPAGAGRPGNAGVGILRGPHQFALAAGLSKTFRLNERARLRAEGTFTNLTNHPNFQAPAVNVSTPITFGKLSGVLGSENGGNRVGQVGVRLDF